MDELKERCRACSQGCIYPSECSYFNKPPLRCMRQLLSEAADAIEELSAVNERQLLEIAVLSKPRWIPVTERLPEPETDVLSFRIYGSFSQLSEVTINDMNKRGEWQYKGVTHWMPLPEPPKDGE